MALLLVLVGSLLLEGGLREVGPPRRRLLTLGGYLALPRRRDV
ncbi:MAG: hypothetical protein ACRDNW_19730 [Trebonia sp.]